MRNGLRIFELMVRRVLLILLILFVCHTLSAQESKERKNMVFFELYGAANEGIGLGYERYLPLGRLFRCTIRAGLSHDNNFEQVPAFIGHSLMFGKRHRAEVGLNFLIKYPQITLSYNSEYNESNDDINSFENGISSKEIVHRKNIFNFLFGYRYQGKRIMARVFLGTPIPDDRYLISGPHVGASLGYSF